MSSITGVWERLDPAAAAAAPDAPTAAVEQEASGPSRVWQIVHRLDVLAAVFWAWTLMKVFVGDWDQALLRRLAPGSEWILNFRILIFVIAVLILFKLGKKFAFLWIAYLAIWPLAVICWRIPRLIQKSAGWNGMVGMAHILSGFLRGVKWTLTAVALSVGSLLLLALPGRWSAWTAVLAALALLTWLLYTSVRASLAPSRFMRMQARIFKLYTAAPTAEYKNLLPVIESGNPLDAAQTQVFLTQAGNSLLLSRLVYFWAYRVNEYRKSRALILFNALSVVWLFLASVVAFTMMNIGLYQADPKSFEFSGSPSVIKFFYYSTVATSGGETTLVQPVGDVAVLVKTFEFIVGAILVLCLFVSIFLSFRAARDSAEARETVDAIRLVAKRAEGEFTSTYGCSPEEAVQRLNSFGHGSIAALALITIPEGFMSPDAG